MQKENAVDYYMGLPYKRVIIPDPDGGYVGEVPELPGCLTQGDTLDELNANFEEAMRLWLEVSLEEGFQIPEPSSYREYSGQFNVRVPSSLHKALVVEAKEEGISLNAMVNAFLERSVAEKRRPSPRKRAG